MTSSVFLGTFAQRCATIFGLVAALSIGTAPGSAQTASIAGTVRDATTGQPLGGATVMLASTPLTTTTNAQGRFAIGGLTVGNYTVHVAVIGFSSDSMPAISLRDGEQREITLLLHPVALRLQEVVVTASRAAERSEDAIASVAALPSEHIIQRNVTAIDEALVYVPGVSVNSGNQLDIRGVAGMARGIGSRVLVMLDGHPILSGDGAEIDFGTIPMLDLDRSEIVKGAYSALYGSNALGGVVNLLTTTIDSLPSTVLRAHANAYNYQQQYEWSDGRQGAIGIGLQHSRMIGSIGTRAAFGYEGTNGFSENGESTRWLGRVKLSSPNDTEAPWDAFAIFVRQRAGEAFVWRSADEPYLVPPDAAGDYTMEHTLLTGASVTPWATTSALFRVSPHFNLNSVNNHFSDNDDWHDAFKPGLLAQLSWYSGDRQALTVGLDGSHTWVRSNFLGQPKILDVAAFLQDEVKFTSALKGSFGLRVDHHKADVGDAEWAISPKAGLALRVAPRATIRASIGSGYRAPSAIEQFVSSRQFGFEVIPNPELRGEKAWSGEIGTTVTLFDRVRIDAAAFGSSYRDLIGPGPAPGQPFVFQFQNVSRARLAGIDLGINAYLAPDRLEVQTGYMFLTTEDLDTGKSLPYRSRHNLTGTVSLLQGLAAVDVRYRSQVEEVLAYPLDPRSDITVVDLRLGYRALDLLWQLKVSNVFNQFFVDVQERNPGAPRSIGITVVHGL
jgi:outer membrane receptor protein involved in Fe transport